MRLRSCTIARHAAVEVQTQAADGHGRRLGRARPEVQRAVVGWGPGLAPGTTGPVAQAHTDTCFGEKVTIRGTEYSDTIDGTSGDDVIDGGGDVINGLEGDDMICAGDLADSIDSGPGDDHVWGGGGDDDVVLGDGDDYMEAGDHSDDRRRSR
jgi:Ca2+-binding RTX toxin-like protein